jgi:L-aminopeptidase/D-esterase-like protein
LCFIVSSVVSLLIGFSGISAESRPRARDLGIAPGVYPPGQLDAITDVHGVRVGHTTIVEGDTVRTGVTAVVPHEGNVFQDKVAGAVFVGNAFGKLAGSTQVAELGTIETPIVLTNTLSVGIAIDAVVRYTLAQPGNEQVRSVNAIVGETNDGTLNDIRGLHVTRDHVLDAIRRAAAGPVAEGSVGAGTGTIAFGWKGGIGTASRPAPCSAWREPDRRTATAAATSRSRSRLRPTFAAASARPHRGRTRRCRPMPSRRCSTPPSKRPRKRCTTRCCRPRP